MVCCPHQHHERFSDSKPVAHDFRRGSAWHSKRTKVAIQKGLGSAVLAMLSEHCEWSRTLSIVNGGLRKKHGLDTLPLCSPAEVDVLAIRLVAKPPKAVEHIPPDSQVCTHCELGESEPVQQTVGLGLGHPQKPGAVQVSMLEFPADEIVMLEALIHGREKPWRHFVIAVHENQIPALSGSSAGIAGVMPPATFRKHQSKAFETSRKGSRNRSGSVD